MSFTENTEELQQGINLEILLHRMTNRIRQSLELEEILTATVAEIRSLIRSDRVIVYRFHGDSSGEVIAESRDETRLPSLLGLNFPADDIPPKAREWILKTRQRSIVDVAKQQIGTSLLDCSDTGKPLVNITIHYRPADPCHIQYLTAMGVQFSLSVPILHRQELWGLLVAHHAQSLAISDRKLQAIQQVVDQVSIAIAQSTLLRLAREQAQQEATVNRVATLLHSQPNVQLQAALEATVAIFSGSGGRLFIAPEEPKTHTDLYICGTQPLLIKTPTTEVLLETENNPKEELNNSETKKSLPVMLEQHPIWQQWLETPFKALLCQEFDLEATESKVSRLWTITDLYQDSNLKILAPAFRETQIRGLLIIPLHYHKQYLGTLTIFRDEVETEILWAGHFDSDNRQLQPRKSFEAWRELKKGQARQWTAEEVEMAQALGNHFSMAVQQYQLYQQVQLFNANLERQVEERTIQLQQSLNLAEVVKQVTAQIRSTLDLETILQTIVREVGNLLDTDRVLIYKFNQGLREVVVEAVKGNWIHLRETIRQNDYFPPEYFNSCSQAKVEVINDISRSHLNQSYKDFLQKIQVKAKLVVPIRISEQLWGLLITHSCASVRIWQAGEIEMLQQLADEAAIAIQQAELYEQTRVTAEVAQAQAEKLEIAAEQQRALFEVISKIRESLDLNTIFQATAREVRQLLNAERVGVFHFTPNSNWEEGEFLSEDVLPGFPSVLGLKICDHCFGNDYVLHYRQGKILATDDIFYSGLTECHRNLLSQFQVKANLVAPLIEGDNLWGLLCIHQCSSPRHWHSSEIEFVGTIATQLGIALQQAELLAQTKKQTEQLYEAFQELQQTQSQLIQTEKMSSLGQLVAGIAHEINNPINFIYGNINYVDQYAQDLVKMLELYQQYYPNPAQEILSHAEEIDLDFLIDDLNKMLSSMKIGTDRIRQLVLSLRNFSRLDQAERKPVNIHEGIDSTLLILQHRLKARGNYSGATVVKEYGDLPPVECYAGQLNQVLMNVISNAIDALEQREEQQIKEGLNRKPNQITIRTEIIQNQDNDISYAVIRIGDNGLGIPEGVKTQIFNPFFTTKPVGKGTGLGLSISYQIIVDKHGGMFKCNSHPGEGTEFVIEIPIS